jgi:glucokinase
MAVSNHGLQMRRDQVATGAVDIGGTKIAVGLIDASGRVLAREQCPTAAHDGFGAAMARIATMLENVCERTGADLRGIGIGCTGPVDPFTGEIGVVDFLPGWEGCNPVSVLSNRFELTVAMENDADAAALAEARWGAGRAKQSLIYVTVSTGIGGGIVVNRSLYRGAGGMHPEIGHHVISDSGPLCGCGARGCWEVLARGPAMAERVLLEAPADYPHRDTLTAAEVCTLARQQDPLAMREIVREGRYLGIGIANLVTLFAPDLIVLGGGVMSSADLFMSTIRATVRHHCGLIQQDRVSIVTSSLGEDTALIGAAVVWQQRVEQNGRAERA